MNIVIVTEKPSIARTIAPAARAHWPRDNITFFNVVPYANILHRYTRGLTLSDLPHVAPFQFKLKSAEDWVGKPMGIHPDGNLFAHQKAQLGLIKHADLVVFACDPDPTGAHCFALLVGSVLGDEQMMSCPALWLSSIDGEAILKGLKVMQPFGQRAEQALAAGRIKRHFDWNWNTNSLIILSQTLRKVGGDSHAPPVSKYALQLLYALRGRAPMSEGNMVKLMHDWPGTGRHTSKANTLPAAQGETQHRPVRASLGSAASRTQIIEDLERAGLLNSAAQASEEFGTLRKKLALSELGESFLGALHPDCEDPDLPSRLEVWQRAGDVSIQSVDRYIRTFFGKQLRFQRQ